jgi:hypothetical protein
MVWPWRRASGTSSTKGGGVALNDALNRIIDDGIETARAEYTRPDQKLMLVGAIKGLEECRGKTPAEIAALITEAEASAVQAAADDPTYYWFWRCRVLEIKSVAERAAQLYLLPQPTGRRSPEIAVTVISESRDYSANAHSRRDCDIGRAAIVLGSKAMPSLRREVASSAATSPGPSAAVAAPFRDRFVGSTGSVVSFPEPERTGGSGPDASHAGEPGRPAARLDRRDRQLESRSLSAVSELPPIPPRRTAAIPDVVPIAPAIGSFNIPLPGGASDEGDIVSAEGNASDAGTRSDQPFNLDLERLTATESKPAAAMVWMGRSLFALSLSVIVAFTWLLGIPNRTPADVAVEAVATTTVQTNNSTSVADEAARLFIPAGLAGINQKGFGDGPLPIGISVKNGRGGETVAMTGLAEGTELSAGSSQGASGWLLSASDLDWTFIAPPKKFIGAMQVSVTLLSATGQILDGQVIRLEWIEEQSKASTEPAKSARPAEVRSGSRSRSKNYSSLRRGPKQ